MGASNRATGSITRPPLIKIDCAAGFNELPFHGLTRIYTDFVFIFKNVALEFCPRTEVEQNADLDLGSPKVIQNLFFPRRFDRAAYLQFDDNSAIDQQIRPEISDLLTVIQTGTATCRSKKICFSPRLTANACS